MCTAELALIPRFLRRKHIRGGVSGREAAWHGRLSQNTSNGNVGDADGVPDMISASSRIPVEVLDVPYRVWSRQSASARTDLTNTPRPTNQLD